MADTTPVGRDDSIVRPADSAEVHRAARRAALTALRQETLVLAEKRERAAWNLITDDTFRRGSLLPPTVISPQLCRDTPGTDRNGITALQHYNASVGLHLFALDLAFWLHETPRRPA